VTDGTGQYRIEGLRPGAYSVTFTLPGFATVRREGIELTGTFVASVNAEMRVGELAETITVTGETPVVDVQSTTRQTVLSKEVLEALPTGRTTIISAGRVRTTANFDLYNLLNANPVLTLSPAFATWQQPQSILNPRFAKIVLRVDF
jgi:hypothetical protein